MKRGMLAPEELVKLTLSIILAIALFSILATFVYYLLYPPLTEPQKDFKRLTTDIQDIIEAKTNNIELRTPMQAKESYILTIIPKNAPESPKKCLKQACVCLTETKNKEPFETCKTYPPILEYQQNLPCGQLSIEKPTRITITAGLPTSILVKKECNKLTIG